MSKVIKNLLVQYKGGGYDGCFWEWNYFCFDANGEFHVIAASGRKGIKDAATARALIAAGPTDSWGSQAFYAYKLTKKSDREAFTAESAATHVAGVVQKVNAIYGKDLMSWDCDACGCAQFTDDMHHDGYKGDGGIGVQMLGMLCAECYCSNLCQHCGEYDADGQVEVTFIRSGHKTTESCCKWCAESLSKSECSA